MTRRRRALLHDESTSIPAKAPLQRQFTHEDERTGRLQALPGTQAASLLLAPTRGQGALRQQSAVQLSRTLGNRQVGHMLGVQRAASGPPTLRTGSRGEPVQQLQTQLNQNGASLTADGVFGAQTAAAVRAFQQARGLAADGVVGPQTWAALRGGGPAVGASPAQQGPASGGGPPPAVAAGLSTKLAQVQALAAQLQSQGKPAPQIEAGTPEEPTQLPPPLMQHDGWLDDIADAAGEAWDEAKGAASGVVNDVTAGAGEVWNDVKQGASEAWNDVSTGAGEVWDDVSKGAGEVWNDVKQGAGEAWNDVSKGAGDLWNDAKESAGDAWDSVKELTGIENIPDKISEIVNGIKKTVEGIIDTVVETAKDLAKGVGSLADKILEVINDPWKVVQAIDDLLKKLKEMVGGKDGNDAVSGTFASETLANPNVCQDAPAAKHPGSTLPGRPLNVQFRFHVDSQTVQEPPEVAVNHDRMYGISAGVEYISDITRNDSDIVQVPKTDFGTTGARVSFSGKFNHADRDSDTVFVDATLKHRQSYAITESPGREDIPINLSNITKENWGDAALDIDTGAWKTSLGAPLRKKFWCSDITWSHEAFHAADADGYMQNKAAPQLESEFNGRQINVPWIIDRETEIKSQLKQISDELTNRATELRNKHMASPASEQRAYANDAPSYEARAFAIRAEAKRNGWDKDDKKK